MQHTIISRVAGGVVIGKNGQVVLVNQNNDSWSLPKGHIEKEEDAIEAAMREIAEESGITQLEFIKDMGSYERYKLGQGGNGEDTAELKKIQLFLFTTKQVILKPTDPSNPEARWVDIDDVGQLLSHPKDREFFEKIKSEITELANRP
jgi:ADP-ribose pyrophosphatase YjhB (NUDIX family)